MRTRRRFGKVSFGLIGTNAEEVFRRVNALKTASEKENAFRSQELKGDNLRRLLLLLQIQSRYDVRSKSSIKARRNMATKVGMIWSMV